jgi:hypothetical protein
MNELLRRRARLIQERALIRAWEYRQRHASHGVWHRLRRALVDAAQAWIISEEDADRLETHGHVPLPVGRELEPAKRMFFLAEDELSTLSGRRRTAVRLSRELLLARSVALVGHSGDAPRPR